MGKVMACLAVGVAVLFLGGASCAAEGAPGPGVVDLSAAVEAAAAAVTPALVRIHVVSADYWSGRETKSEASGSGVIFSPEGYVITNHHVAGNAKQLICTLSTKEEVDAELVGTDPLTDIAVIKLLPDKPRRFPAARFGDSSRLRVGDPVLAMGSPLALSQSVTMGIVSNTALVMPDMFWPLKIEIEGEDVGSVVRWIGHDAQIAPGNSGGPLVNLAGEVVGINEIQFGLGGAIPGNLARKVAEELVKRGKVVRAWLGLEVQPLLQSQAGMKGALVSGAIPGSPAAKAGIRSGDILVSLGGRPVSVEVPEEIPLFNQLVADLPIGKPAEAVVLRHGKRLTLSLVPIEREPVRPKARELPNWGVTARNLSLLTAKELKRDTTDGVQVVGVRPGGPCDEAKPKIVEKDIIVEVNGRAVKGLDDLIAITRELTEGKTERVATPVEFERKAERLLTVVKLGKRPVPEPDREVRKAWLPVATQPLTREMAEALGIPNETGVRVTQVYAGTSAAEAGLQVGDIIVAVDGDRIPASRAEDFEVFPAMIRQYKIGSQVELTVIRGGQRKTIQTTLMKSRPGPREMRRYRDDRFDFTAREVAFTDRVQRRLPEDQPGVLVESVTEGGWAALAHLAVGDLILEVGVRKTPDIESLEKAMQAVADAKPKSVVFHVKRGIHELFVEMRPKWSER